MDKKKKKKNLAFSLLLAVGMLLPSRLLSQEQNDRPGGLFGETAPTASDGLMRRNEGTAGGYFTEQGFGATWRTFEQRIARHARGRCRLCNN